MSASHSNIEIYFFPRFKEKEVNISSHWSDHLPTKNDKITGVRLLPILWPDSSGWNFPLIFFRISSIFSFLFLKIFRRLFVAQFHIENFSFYEIKCVRRCTRIDQKRGRRLIHSRRVDDGYFWKQIGWFHQFFKKNFSPFVCLKSIESIWMKNSSQISYNFPFCLENSNDVN